LCDQHAVEGIFVHSGQRAGALSVLDRDWKLEKTEAPDPLGEFGGKSLGAGQLADANLRRNLPG
jgi:hypothetical protein